MQRSSRGAHGWFPFLFVLVLAGCGQGRKDAALDKQVTLRGHHQEVLALAFGPEGGTLASAGDNVVQFWDLAEARPRASFDQHTNTVTGVAFSPDGKTLFTSSTDGTVKVADAASLRVRFTLNAPGDNPVMCLALSPTSDLLASGIRVHTVRLWDVALGREKAVLEGHTSWIRALAFSPDGKWLVSAAGDVYAPNTPGEVKLWDVATCTERLSCVGHSGAVLGVAFAPSGKTLATASCDRTVNVWDVDTGQLLHRYTGHEGWVLCVAFSPDGKYLASGSMDRTIRLWDVAQAREPAILREHPDGILCLAFAPDGKQLASGSADKTVKLWELPP